MTLRLVLESAPHAQAEKERVFLGGTLVIGRGDEADWQFNDPDMYVSRRHCIISDESGSPMATDASSGGLFIDNAANPVGTGNSVPIDAGMRLRMGDFVIKVEAHDDADKAPEPQPAPQPGAFSFDFGAPPEPEEKRERPDSLPDPFDPRAKSRGRDPFGLDDEPEEQPLKPVDWENPMGLDLRKGGPVTEPGRTLGPTGFGNETSGDAASSGGQSGASKYFFGGDPQPDYQTPPAERRDLSDEPPVVAEARQDPFGEAAPPPPEPPVETAPVQERSVTARSAAPVSDDALRAALMRGMGLDPARFPTDDPEAEMEELGARFRELVDGLMMLLRSRAQEKSRARVSQTVIANENVNPLKFLATSRRRDDLADPAARQGLSAARSGGELGFSRPGRSPDAHLDGAPGRAAPDDRPFRPRRDRKGSRRSGSSGKTHRWRQKRQDVGYV